MDMSRISLRPFNLSDADDLILWANDDRVTRYLRWYSIQTRDQALAFLEKVLDPKLWIRSICLDGRSIGYVGASLSSRDERCRAQISYALAWEHWGKGIVTFALKMAVPKVFGEFAELVRLEALVVEENRASQRVVEKVGFLKEGLLRRYRYKKGEIKDMIIYSFVSTDELSI